MRFTKEQDKLIKHLIKAKLALCFDDYAVAGLQFIFGANYNKNFWLGGMYNLKEDQHLSFLGHLFYPPYCRLFKSPALIPAVPARHSLRISPAIRSYSLGKKLPDLQKGPGRAYKELDESQEHTISVKESDIDQSCLVSLWDVKHPLYLKDSKRFKNTTSGFYFINDQGEPMLLVGAIAEEQIEFLVENITDSTHEYLVRLYQCPYDHPYATRAVKPEQLRLYSPTS